VQGNDDDTIESKNKRHGSQTQKTKTFEMSKASQKNKKEDFNPLV